MTTKRYAAVLRRDDKTLFVGLDAENLPEACQTLAHFNVQPESITLLKSLAAPTRKNNTPAQPVAATDTPQAAEESRLPLKFYTSWQPATAATPVTPGRWQVEVEKDRPHIVRRTLPISGLPQGVRHLVVDRGYTACGIDLSRANWTYVGLADKYPVTCAQCRNTATAVRPAPNKKQLELFE